MTSYEDATDEKTPLTSDSLSDSGTSLNPKCVVESVDRENEPVEVAEEEELGEAFAGFGGASENGAGDCAYLGVVEKLLAD